MAVSRTKQFSGSGNVMGGSLVVSSHSPLQQRLTAGTFQPQGVGCRVFGFPQSCHTALSQQVPLWAARPRPGWDGQVLNDSSISRKGKLSWSKTVPFFSRSTRALQRCGPTTSRCSSGLMPR